MNDKEYERLATEVLKKLMVQREKAVSSTPTAVLGHGPGGLFSTPGLSKSLFSAMVLPRLGLQSKLPTRPTVETNPLEGIITGVTASSGSNPDGVCDDPPVSGTTKLCVHSFPLGLLSRQTKVFDIKRIGKMVNRGEFSDFDVYGDPFAGGGSMGAPSIPGGSGIAGAARTELGKALFELGVAWIRDFARLIYSGNPTNNTAGGGYREFYGLESLVNTGYRDVETGILCPAADSMVYDFGSLDASANSAALVRRITFTMRNLRHLASRANLAPVRWEISMSFGLFYALTEIWPIAYSTYRDSGIVPAGATLYVDSNTIEQQRQAMRGNLESLSGQYLLIDGQQVPVTIDDAITETDDGGAFVSDIYFIPITVLGGRPVTYFEHFNYDAPGASMDFANTFAPGDSFSVSDGGRFLWHKKPPTNTCVQIASWTEPRLIMLTPYLAARIQNVKYEPLEHERSWDPTNASYWKDGGRTTGTGVNPSYLVIPG